MKKELSILFALVGWFAVIGEYILWLKQDLYSLAEMTIQYLSYFTILTNALVAYYFSHHAIKRNKQVRNLDKPGVLTALVVYIIVVGLVYNTVLRQTMDFKGLEMILVEIMHSVVPLCVILYWYLYENKIAIKWRELPKWLIYPAVYLVLILIRGKVSWFYPYPFTDVSSLGLIQVLINLVILLFMMLLLSAVFVGLGKRIYKRK